MDTMYIGSNNLHYEEFAASKVYYFNKTRAADYKLEDPYQLVRDNKWTYEKFIEMASVLPADLNGDGVRDREDAYRILKKLSGRTHTVYTGVAVLTDDSTQICHDTTHVTFEELDDRDIWAYIDSGEPMDKAGAYGIQGAFAKYITGISGDYFNVVGLPVCRLGKELKENFGIELFKNL